MIDAVGVDAEPSGGPADAGVHTPGQAPRQAAEWAVQTVAKAGSIGIIGVYGPEVTSYPLGAAMNRNLTIKMGNCPHRRSIPTLLELVNSGVVEPGAVLSQDAPVTSALAAYEAFDQRRPGWMKVSLEPGA